jgi:rSAM/selenodomain-associated transferase 1
MFSNTDAAFPMKGALVVCAQAPLPGQVKTSFHSHLTEEQSAGLYRRFLTDTCETTLDVEGVDFFLAHDPEAKEEHFEGILPPSFTLFPQAESGKSRRLADIFERLLTGGYERVLVLCSDTPDLPICLVNQAADVLASGRAEMVYGPSEQDGFYLLGLRRWHRDLFENVDWESPQAGSRALREARKLGMRVRSLPEWYRIDTVEDLRRHLTYYTLRRGSCADTGCQCRTGEYLFEIQESIV